MNADNQSKIGPCRTITAAAVTALALALMSACAGVQSLERSHPVEARLTPVREYAVYRVFDDAVHSEKQIEPQAGGEP